MSFNQEDLEREIHNINTRTDTETQGPTGKSKVIYGEYAAYIIEKKKAKVNDARKKCLEKEDDANLATPSNIQMNTEFEKIMKKKKGTYWVGLHEDENEDGMYSWNGVVDDVATLYITKFISKRKGCLSIKVGKKSQTWAFAPCTKKNSYVCSFPPVCESKGDKICFKGAKNKCLAEDAICDGMSNCANDLDEEGCAYTECDAVTFDDTRPTVWVDDAPDCMADESLCEFYGMEYVCSDSIEPPDTTVKPTLPFPLPNLPPFLPGPLPVPTGINPTQPSEDPSCKNGTKVLCQVGPPVNLTDPQPANSISVIAYNIFELQYIISQDGQRQRTCRILFNILESTTDIDVIVFNEVFMGGCFAEVGRLDLRELLRYHGFIHYTETVGVADCQFQVAPNIENGGVLVASRWPILYEEEIIFENYYFPDGTFFCKGVMYAKIEKTMDGETMLYHIFGTHMQAYVGEENDATRVLQAAEMYDFMKKFDIPENEPVLYAGDFNADMKANEQNGIDVLNELHSTMPTIIGDYDHTYDRINNDLRKDPTSYKSWLDYVVWSHEHLIPLDSTIEVLRLRHEWMDVCRQTPFPTNRHIYPNTDDCFDTWIVGDMSDHYAVRGILHYEITTAVGSLPMSNLLLISLLTLLSAVIA
ncbi:uncharacterized protein LOC144434140 [Glandiceps talaboti]